MLDVGSSARFVRKSVKPHAAELGHPAHVVAAAGHEQEMFGALLLVGGEVAAQRLDPPPASRRAGGCPAIGRTVTSAVLDADQHFGRTAHQGEVIEGEVKQIGVRDSTRAGSDTAQRVDRTAGDLAARQHRLERARPPGCFQDAPHIALEVRARIARSVTDGGGRGLERQTRRDRRCARRRTSSSPGGPRPLRTGTPRSRRHALRSRC